MECTKQHNTTSPMKTKEQVMQEVFDANPYCSAGDIVFALRTKWHGKKQSSYSDDALSFLKKAKDQWRKKREEYFANKHYMEETARSFHEFQRQLTNVLINQGLNGSAASFSRLVNDACKPQKQGNMSNAFAAVGL